MTVQPYLFFNGRAEEAIAFYRKAAGAEVAMKLRFRDAPDPSATPPGMADKVMHAELRIAGASILASDGCTADAPAFQGFSLCLTVASEEEAGRLFAALGEGGEVQMALEKTFFATRFGALKDRFGVSWMIHLP